jgi:hypothetical protein|tara:strand:+ start:651 stop:938 length:288 start_codon:yes stop_codon:yes gene_type:complete
MRKAIKHNTSDGAVIEVVQDVTDIVELNKIEYNTAETKWGDDVLDNRVARLPNTVWDQLDKDGITRCYHVLDQKRFRDFLNHPDNRFFRTKPGKL